MDTVAQQKPCLVSTTQGFSVLYKEKYLYSKYNPLKTINSIIEKTAILPGTIILCCSPLLNYGIEELHNKLPENCIMIGCEPDSALLEFSKQNNSSQDKLVFLSIQEFYNFPQIIEKKSYTFENGRTVEFAGNFKRVLRIDFSAGVQFNTNLFTEFYTACEKEIKNFWTNRITLCHFGRRYSKNYFTNLHNLENTIPIKNYFQKINKPIIVCGAGQSLESLYNDIKDIQNNFFILCVDTALCNLISHNIIPDCVFLDEAQQVISKAFIGTQKYNFHLFASLCSLPQLQKDIQPERISYYTTVFTQSDFITSKCNFDYFPAQTVPLGSVGLTAVSFACKFRENQSIPIYIYGLDFSYSAGFTHAKQTIAHKENLLNSNKLKTIQNYNASFNPQSLQITDKRQNKFYSTPILLKYANLFTAYFNQPNIYDSTDCGVDLHLPCRKPEPVSTHQDCFFKPETYLKEDIKKINDYLLSEKTELLKLKDILSGNTKLSKEEALIQIKKIVQNKEYLYLHFPDGYKLNDSQSFLNRIRVEIDYFLKYI